MKQKELNDGRKLFRENKDVARLWNGMGGGKLKRDPSEAQSQIQNNIEAWAAESRLPLQSVKPERTEKEKGYMRLTMRVSGTGNMEQIGRFLHRIQTATIPARITDMTLTARKENTDDMSLLIGIATLYQPVELEKPASGGAKDTTP